MPDTQTNTTTAVGGEPTVISSPAITLPTTGWKTSEFWKSGAVILAIYLNESGALGSFKIPTEMAGLMALMVFGYLANRGYIKGKASDAQAQVAVAQVQAAAQVEVVKAATESMPAPEPAKFSKK